jgi:hypothetical protein
MIMFIRPDSGCNAAMRYSVSECFEQDPNRLRGVSILGKEPGGVFCYVLLAETVMSRFAEIETSKVFKRRAR